MTGMQFADILRDARTLSRGAPAYAWVRTWKTARGVTLEIAAAEAANAAGRDGFLALWLGECAKQFDGRYTVNAAEFARAMEAAARVQRASGAVLFPSAAACARDAKTFSAWSAAALAGGLHAPGSSEADERVFLPWLRAMCARYQQE